MSYDYQQGKPCTFPGCTKPRKARGICSGHWAQQARGFELTPLLPASRKNVSPEFEAQILRVVETAQQLDRKAQAKLLGVSIDRIGFLRYQARLRGHELPRPRKPPAPYHDEDEYTPRANNVPRCRCGLLLPCNNCLPGIVAYAEARNPQEGG